MTSNRRAQFLLYAAAALCAAGGLFILIDLQLEPTMPPTVAEPGVAASARPSSTPPALPTIASFEPIFRRNLSGAAPLSPTTKPSPVKPTITANAPANLKLIGTAVEPGHSYGIFLSGLNN